MKEQEVRELLKSIQNPLQDYAAMVDAPAWAYGKRYVYPELEDYAIEEAITVLKEKQKGRWIPVEERLPSTSGKFEVTIKGSKGKRYVEMCDFQKEAFPDWRWGGRYGTKNVIAWRARPEPYNPQN